MDNGTTPRRRRKPPRKVGVGTELVKPTGRQPATSKQYRLRELERDIAEAKEQFWRTVGASLREIRRDKLYELNHGTWDEYLRDRWDLSRSYASRLIDGINTVEQLERTLEASGLSPDVAHGQRGITNEREARAIKGKVPVIAERVRQGMPVDEAITKTAYEADQQREQRQAGRRDRQRDRQRAVAAGPQPSPIRALGDFIVKSRRLRRDLLDVVEAAQPFMSEHGDEERLLAEATRLRSAAGLLEDIAKGDDLEAEIVAFLESEEGA